ncbi:secretin N-terminal domain-containing protein [Arenicella xantha]|uniref:Type II secretion system protein D (GspD) n=1 Tax=Arenicella xantha TaxID=644221 RepID=A0A395JKR4_9GAMM|nr:secretin N-terminal domain-containing protein [Arenicella xantha]RBP51362.1 type II secretion system protein D (GspD) [Arenicella xantha]
MSTVLNPSRLFRTATPQLARVTLRSTLVLVCSLVTFSSGVATAQRTDPVVPAAQQGEQGVRLNLQDVDIRVLINTVAEVSGKNFIVDPRVKGKVSVISGAPLGPDQLYDVFLSILEVHNFATVDSGSVIKVLPSNVIKQQPTPTLFTPTTDTNDAQITQIIQLEYASVQDLVPIIRPLIPPTSHFAPHVPSNSVVITDTTANIQRVLKIINRIDIPDKRANIRVVNLNHAKASNLATTLTQLITSTADPKDSAGSAKVSIQPFDTINSLIISAPDDQFAKVQALIDQLDIEREIEGDVNVIRLKHAKAEDLASILKDVTATKADGAVSEFTVQADEASNSLIVKASGTQLRTVQSVVAELDKRRAQVYVETIIAEVSLDQQAKLGINWNLGSQETTSTTVDGDGNSSSSVSTSPIGIIDPARPGQTIGNATTGQNFALGTAGYNYSLLDFSKYQLDIVLNAIRSDSNSDVLSTPTILTLDNEEAEIVIGQEVPFVTGTFNSGINSSVNQGENQNSSLGTGFQTIERKDVGIKLKIKPQINDGDTIQLEVLQETSSLVTQAVAGSSDLITNRRSIEAVVQVDDGQVVVLGGLITENVVDTVNKVPFLGDIPILGVLFRSKEKKVEKRNLMVFLKPRIIRSPHELASYSKVKYDEVRRDGQISRLNSSDLLIPEAEPPVLVKYETTLGDGQITTESRLEGLQSGEIRKPLKSRIKNIIFGRKKKPVDPPYRGNDAGFDPQPSDAELEQIKIDEMVDELESTSSEAPINGSD